MMMVKSNHTSGFGLELQLGQGRPLDPLLPALRHSHDPVRKDLVLRFRYTVLVLLVCPFPLLNKQAGIDLESDRLQTTTDGQ
ncbi:hypothetical protein DPMN_107450 [Dreissena polymorpha]|uniref:Uncharacterized protein n=1 Tax=Dreissena polymorpha TaxID=45954 RepID=A0A9D4K774_DREPO|nr:hypothetical protein DPMN_107450 [Dreissena polymorpha]